jgi:hypothetical protein
MDSSQNARHAQMTTTNGHTIQRNTGPGLSPRSNLQESPATAIDATNSNNTSFCDCEDDKAKPHRYEYKDWILFDGDPPILSTENFFADLDASTNPNHGSITARVNNESTSYNERAATYDAQAGQSRRTTFYDPVHDAVQQSIDQSIYKALSDFEVRSKPDYSPPLYEKPNLNPLENWYNTYERHESIAYRLELPPNPARPQQQSRQPS